MYSASFDKTALKGKNTLTTKSLYYSISQQDDSLFKSKPMRSKVLKSMNFGSNKKSSCHESVSTQHQLNKTKGVVL